MQTSKLFLKFIQFLELQFFITITSLPILIFWGLPISLMSPLGNLFFTPILTVFLFFSTLIFFTELVGIPNKILIFILEKISDFWIYLINFGQSNWLINFKIQYLLILLVPVIIFSALTIKSKYSSYKKTLILFFLITLSFFILSLNKNNHQFTISNSKGKILCCMKNNKIDLIDYGALSCSSVKSWIDFNLLTEISKKFGSRDINSIKLNRINKTQLEAIFHLIETANLKRINLKNIPKNTLLSEFMEKFNQKNSHIKIIS